MAVQWRGRPGPTHLIALLVEVHHQLAVCNFWGDRFIRSNYCGDRSIRASRNAQVERARHGWPGGERQGPDRRTWAMPAGGLLLLATQACISSTRPLLLQAVASCCRPSTLPARLPTCSAQRTVCCICCGHKHGTNGGARVGGRLLAICHLQAGGSTGSSAGWNARQGKYGNA